MSVEKLRQQSPPPELKRQALAVPLAFSFSRKAAAVQEVKALVCFPCPFSLTLSSKCLNVAFFGRENRFVGD